MAQIGGVGEAQKKEQQNQPIIPRTIDTIPLSVPFHKKELTEEEKKAQQFFSEGVKKAKESDYTGAIEDFTQSLTFVKSWNTYMKRGYAYLLTGEFPLALQDFTEVMQLSPSNKDALFGLAVARFEMKDYDGAEGELKKYTELVNNNPDAYNYLAAICFIRQDYMCALQNYSQVIRYDSTFTDGYANRAMIRHYLRDYKGALEDYDIAQKQNPYSKKIYNNRAATEMMLKDYQKALVDFNHAIELDSVYADAYNNRGRVRFYMGDTEGACSDWHKALSFGIEASRDLIIKNCK